MMISRRFTLGTLVLIFTVAVAGCSPHTQYRTNYEPCINAATELTTRCLEHAIQQVPTAKGANYLLNFIELDDQGQLWDRKQLRAVVDNLYTRPTDQNLLMVVFVHGWKHSAAPNDPNIETFRQVLSKLADDEKYISQQIGLTQRQVVGVYIGWRGGSVPIPVVENLTFWDRKNTAQKVGHGGVTEVLSRLEVLKKDKNSVASDKSANTITQLIVVGHSFGGAVVHTALSQILTNRFATTTASSGAQGDIGGFGNLVVLINPAFEAALLASLSDMSAERGFYSTSQLPVMAILTSEADAATRRAFPMGRWLSTFFESTRNTDRWNAVKKENETIAQSKSNVIAVGHFEPYRTHTLYPDSGGPDEPAAEMKSSQHVDLALSAGSAWQHDKPGSKIQFHAVTLERTKTSAGRNPYLVVYVDKALIHDHNHIDDPRIVGFVKQLILISSLSDLSENQRQTLMRSSKEGHPIKQ